LTGAEALAAGVRRLRAAGIPEAAGDARRLLAHALGVGAGRLTPVLPEAMSRAASELYDALLARRERREPVSHLLGARGFWGRDFLVTPDVLDPRPETEVLVAVALREPFRRVLDLGTGSGCILVTLLAERPGAEGVGLDLSEAALAVARRNAARHGVSERAGFAQADWFGGLRDARDLIVSNPPYVAAGELAGLEPEVRDWEPRLALTDGGDGLGAYRAILAEAPHALAPKGRLLLEIGPAQAAAPAAIGRSHGWAAPEVALDLDGRDRVLLFRAPGAPT
jgi:release factor glutamine methyltransferase